MMVPTKNYFFELVGTGASCLLLGTPGFNLCFSFAPGFNKLFGAQGSPSSCSLLNLLSSFFNSSGFFFMICSSVLDDSLTN